MMASDMASVRTLIRDVIGDARDLVRQEIALARVEAREQVAAAKSIGIVFGAAALLAVVGLVLVAAAVSAAIADLFDIPLWASYAGRAVLLAAAAYGLGTYGRARVAETEVLPRTKASFRENLEWIQSKSNSK